MSKAKSLLQMIVRFILPSIVFALLVLPVSLCCNRFAIWVHELWNIVFGWGKLACGCIASSGSGFFNELTKTYIDNAVACNYWGVLLSALIVWCLFFRKSQCVQTISELWSRVKYIEGCFNRLMWVAATPLRKVVMWYARRHRATSTVCRWLVAKQRERRSGCDFHIKKLTPIDTAKNLDCYGSMLTTVLKDDKITNIAVTGRYGAGKSTFLRTYFNGYDVLYVSLAAFIGQLESRKDNESNGNAEDITTKLEWSILQQVIYAAQEKHLPFSRFARITHFSWCKSAFFGLIASFLAICSLVIFQPSKVFLQYDQLSDSTKAWAHFAALFFALFLLIPFVLGVLHRWFVRRHPHVKVETPAFGVDLSKGEGVSVFNRALDELIYFFQQLHYDAVVFEDIDRLDQPLLFTKLREINHILNNTAQIPRSNKPIRFIYAVRDDLFSYDERVKFFDFIIPIFPEFNAEKSNGYILDDIKEVLGVSYVVTGEWDSFVRLFSYYISDRRLWNNIYNEFVLVHSSSPPHLDRKKLLSMILFKNMFPNDYDLAHSRLGILPFILGFGDGHTRNWRSIWMEQLNERQKELYKKYEELKESSAPSWDMDEAKEEQENNRHLLIRARKSSIGMLMKMGDFTYEMFVNAVNDMPNETCAKKMSRREGRMLLLYRLIENGMIDEQYEDYLTNTPNGAMSAKDFLFMHTLLAGGDISNHDIDRPAQVIDQLNRNVFRSRLIRNVKFAQGLIGLVVADSGDITLQGKFDNYIARNFAKGDVDTANFVCELFVRTTDISLRDKWIERIHSCAPKFFEYVLASDEICEDNKQRLYGYCIGFFERYLFIDDEESYKDLMALIADSLANLESLDKVVESSELQADDFCNFLKENKVYLRSASFFSLANPEIRDLILSMGLYVPTSEIIIKLLMHRGKVNADGKIGAPWQAIIDSGDVVLKAKVSRDVAKFLESEYDKILGGEKGMEPAYALLDLINRNDVSIEQKTHLLRSQKSACITAVDDLQKDVACMVIDEGMLVPVWKSVVNAYQKVGYNISLRNFVVKHAMDLCKDDFGGNGGEVWMQCINEILRDTETSDSVVLKLAQSINRESRYWYSSVDFPPGRLAVLCKSKLIRFSVESYEKLKSRRDGSHLILARHNIKRFLDDFRDVWLDEGDAVSLLSSGSEQDKGVGVLLLRKAIGLIRRSDKVKKLLASMIRMRDFEGKTRFTKEMVIEFVDYMESPTCRVYTLLMMDNLSKDTMWRHLTLFPGGVVENKVSMQVSTRVANRFNYLLNKLGFRTCLGEAKRMPRLDVWR